MALVTLASLHSHLLVVLVVLLSLPFLKGDPSLRPSDDRDTFNWPERFESHVPFGESSNDESKTKIFDKDGHQLGRILEEEPRVIGRVKRDIEEIIAGRPVNFPPVVVQRTMDALQQILTLLRAIEKALNTTITTTVAPPTTTTTPTPLPVSPQPSTTPEPVVPPPSPNTTTPPPPSTPIPATTPVPPVANATSAPEGTTPDPDKNESETSKLAARSSEGQPMSMDSTKRPPSLKVEATMPSDSILGELLRSQVRDSDAEPTVSKSNETIVLPLKTYSARDVIIVFQGLAKNAEDVMADQLNMSTVIALEKSVKTLSLVNKTAAYIDRGDGMSELLIWLKLVQTSCNHALNKLQYGKAVMSLFGSSDDITILITAAFCTLALICCIVACLMGRRPLKPSRGNYALDGTPGRARPVPSTRRNTSSASSEPPERTFSAYSSPSRAAVSARSNPSYSSHRSVDVDPATSYRPNQNNLNYDEPRVDADNNMSDPTVAAMNERNANDRPTSTRPSTKSSDYKDPRRHRSSNMARGRNNEGYSGDEVIGVRSDSESVL